jgi:hypothetical protein
LFNHDTSTMQPATVGPGQPPAGRTEKRRRRARLWRLIALVLVLLMMVPTVSYVRALTYPGSATFAMRTVDWVRSNGGGSLINILENWYYTRHKPANTPPNLASLPRVPVAATANPAAGPTPLPLLPGVAPLPGEATWVPGRLGTGGKPALYSGFFRPNPAYQSVVVGAAWMRAGATTGHLVAGTAEPGGTGWPGGAQVAPTDVSKLLATFNSGWKMIDLTGGFYQNGRTARPLVNGQASVVIDDHGNMTVGQWGRDVSMNPHVVAVRQNLALVVDGGHPVPGLAANANGKWGSPKNQYQFTWRSGLGVDAHGNLIYVAGNNLDLTTLATAMVDVGVVRGMQLDIHSTMDTFSWWMPGAAKGSSIPTKLLPDMSRPADRYLVPDQRDFFYLTVR